VNAGMNNKFQRLANWNPPVDQRDPLSVLGDQEEGRIPWLLPIRHGRMATICLPTCAAAPQRWRLIWLVNLMRWYGQKHFQGQRACSTDESVPHSSLSTGYEISAVLVCLLG